MSKSPQVAAVHRDDRHRFSKFPVDAVRLVAGVGIEGDAHAGPTVQHRSRVRRNPVQPNLRQVHLIHEELLAELAEQGFDVAAGGLGENITTIGVDLLGLPRGARLHLGAEAVVAVTGLRNPCRQINDYRPGLLEAVLGRDYAGEVVRKTGVMSVVIRDGIVRPGDPIEVRLPAEPRERLEVV